MPSASDHDTPGSYRLRKNRSIQSLNSSANKSTSSSSCYYSETNLDTSGNKAILTIPQKSKVYHKYDNKNKYQAYIGQLNMSVVASDNKKEIVVSITKASDIPVSSCVVMVSLVGSSSKVRYHQTSAVTDSCNPAFNEQFSFAIKKRDYSNKRIVVSLCSYDSTQNTVGNVGRMYVIRRGEYSTEKVSC